MAANNKLSIPVLMKNIYDDITNEIRDFSDEYLNDEYYALCCELCAALCRKRPSPLNSGNSETWAAGIIHAIGTVNFLFDASQVPHVKASDIADFFDISAGTCSKKSKQIRDIMKIDTFDIKWTLPSKMDDNPMAWLIEVNGIVMDARHCPKELQKEAYKRGLIPYIPE